MIRPTADAAQPRLKQLVFPVTKLGIEFLEQKYGSDFFLPHRAEKKLIRNLHQKIESMLFLNLPPKTDGSAAQIRRGPAMRFNFLLKNRCTPCACSAEPPCRKARRICAAITAGVVLTRAAQA